MVYIDFKFSLYITCWMGLLHNQRIVVDADPFQDLYTKLIQVYNNELTPICQPNGRLTVAVGAALREIMNLDEVDQTIKIKLWVRLKWTDCYLVWNATEHNGISSLILRSTTVWNPDITLFESVNKGITLPGEKDFRVYVSNEGKVNYNFPSVVSSSCTIDVTYFPYDTQNCTLTFASWVESGTVMDVVKNGESGDLKEFLINIEWDVVSMESVRHVQYYGCCPDPFPDVTFYLVIRRKPQFYFLTLIFPCVLLLALAALGFLLPAESGEKMSLQMTVLLSLSVFLLIVTEKLPASAENFPIIGVYFSVSMVLVSVSCLLTAIVLNMFFRHRPTARVPRLIRKYYLHNFRNFPKISCNHKKTLANHRKEKNNEDNDVVITEVEDMTYPSEDSTKDDFSPESQQDKETVSNDVILQEWQDLAHITDKFILLIYVFTTIVTTCSFLLVLELQR